MLLDAVALTVERLHVLVVEFENGERRRFDMDRIIGEAPFRALKGSPLFLRARIESGTVCWPGDIAIAPETLSDLSLPVAGSPAPAPSRS